MSKRRYRIVQDKDDPVVKRQRGAAYVIVIAITLDIVLGLLFAREEHILWYQGLYWAEGEATTVGNALYSATTPGAQIIKAIVGVTVIPLFAATFSIFTTALTATHVHKVESSLKQHVTNEKEAIKRHIGGGKQHG